jgi:hypothetical protein
MTHGPSMAAPGPLIKDKHPEIKAALGKALGKVAGTRVVLPRDVDAILVF